MKLPLLALALSSALATNAYAYISEFEINSLNTSFEFDSDSNAEGDQDLIEAKATIYFGQLDTSKGPLAEAPFTNKKGYFSVGLISGDGEQEDDDSSSTEYDKSTYDDDISGVNFDLYVVMGTFILELEHAKQETDSDYKSTYIYLPNLSNQEYISKESSTTEIKANRLGMGGYLGGIGELVVSLVDTEKTKKFTNCEYNNAPCFKLNDLSTIEESSGIETDIKFLIDLSGEQALSIGGHIGILGTEYDDGDLDGATVNFEIFTTYYITKKLGLNFNIRDKAFAGDYDSSYDSDFEADYTSSTQTIGLGIEYFIIDQLSLSAEYNIASYESEYEFNDGDNFKNETDISTLSFGLKGRF